MSRFLSQRAAQVVAILLLCAATAAALYPASPAVRQAISRDSGVFLYTGWRILQGEVPYRDVWDHKTPGIFYMDALGLALVPDSLWGVWGLELALACLACVLLFLLIRRLFGTGAAALSTLLMLCSLSGLLAGGNLTQIPALPFQAAGLWVALQISRQPGERRLWFWLGVLAAATLLFRQNSLGVFAAAAAWVAFQAVLSRQPKSLLSAGLAAAGGFLAVALPVCLYFAWHGALGDFWDAAFVFNFHYSADGGLRERVEALRVGFGYLAGNGLAVAALLGFGFALRAWLPGKHSSGEPRQFLQYLTLAFVFEALLVAMSGRPRLPYFIAVLPVVTVLAGCCFGVAQRWLAKRFAPRQAQWAFLAATVLVGLSQYPGYQDILRANRGLERPAEVIEYILEHTDEGDYVLLVDAEAGVNFETRRPSPGRFVYQYPLYSQEYAQPKYLEEFFEDVLAYRPALIILTTGDRDMPNRFGGSKTERSEALAHQINRGYQLVKEFENGWVALAPVD